MLDIFRNAWKIKDLRNKILYTLMMLLIYRICSNIPVPNVDASVFSQAMSQGVFAMLDTFNGGTLANFTLMATGITPYITASIVMQLLTIAIPSLERLQKQGEDGRKKINQITRYVGVGMAFAQSLAIMITARGGLVNDAWYMYLIIALLHAGATAFAMWMGERITEKGIGNGISLLIFINIISRIPSQMWFGLKTIIDNGGAGWWMIPALAAAVVVLIAAIVFIDLGERRIPVQYAKRVVGRKMYGGQSTYIPMRVNNSGVLPLIFAMTFVQFPNLILSFFNGKFAQWYLNVMKIGTLPYGIITALLIFAFTYFYSTIAFNPQDVANNVQQYGGFVPGIRPGKPTAQYLSRVGNRITLFAALFYALLAVIPQVVLAATGSGVPLQATSILIMVSVALETSKQLESQMLMRHYKGFLN